MKPWRTLVTLLALILALLIPPAAATASDTTNYPQVVWGIPKVSDPVNVQLQGPDNVWRIRKVADTVREKVPGLRIRLYGTCAERPNYHCVTIRVRDYGATAWSGQTTAYGDGRLIQLNSHYGNHYYVGCHELLHALGMMHHRYWHGCLRSPAELPLPETPAPGEIDTLRAYY